jgi:hypothetical protein
MGCTEARNLSEETSVIEAEKGLRFHLQPAVRVDSIIRKFSANGKINKAQFEKISQILDLRIKNDFENTKIEETLNKLMTPEGYYDIKDWLVIGILLSEGQPGIKAALLYQVFDEDLTNSIGISRIQKEVLIKIIDHSYQTLPMLVTPKQGYIKNEKYVSNMAEAKSLCIDSIGQRLSTNGPNVSETTFVEVFRTLFQGALTTSTGWRKFLIDNYAGSHKKAAYESPYKRIA